MIGKKYREYLDPAILNFDDEKVYQEVFHQGFTDGVFQFESAGMKQTLKNMKPTNLEDLAVANALYRPGSMKYIDNYIRRKHGEEDFEYLHPDLEEVLKPTYGIIVFQEQLIQIGRIAGMRNADLLRQATGKKDVKKLNKAKPELFEGLKKRGWNDEQLEQLWKDMLDFAKYSFNKSHSVAYAIIAYMCAFLKVYHPNEFITATFNSFDGKPERFEGIFLEAKRLGVNVTPINFDNPTPYCTLIDDKVNYGLKLVKHCNLQMSDSLSIVKDKHYDYLMDLLLDIAESEFPIDSRQMNILISLDFFNKFGDKALVKAIYKEFKSGKGIKFDKKQVEKTKLKRIDLRRQAEQALRETFIPPEEKTLYKQLEIEKEFLGYMRSTYPDVDENTFTIIEINDKYTPILSLYKLKTGDIIKLKVKKKKYYDKDGIPYLYVGDVIRITGTSEDGKWYMDENGDWKQREDVTEAFLETCKLVERSVAND